MQKFSREYTRYIKSVQWECVRQKALLQYGRRCAGCMESAVIHMHHLFYPKALTDTTTDHVLPLCESCHKTIHEQKLFHPTVFSVDQCPVKRRQSIIYLQDRARRLLGLARKRKEAVRSADIPAFGPTAATAIHHILKPRYGPRKSKSKRFLSASDPSYAQKIYR